jgi:glycosyltransferase involved in cell wall biosynthesis
MRASVGTPRIGFFGGMANNCYSAASRLSEIGVNVTHILDHTDYFAISNPVWEDCRMALSYAELNASSSWTAQTWARIADEKSWRQPAWVIDPRLHPDETEPDWRHFSRDLVGYLPAPPDHFRKIINIMNSCDLLFVSNMAPIILAMMSTTPFVICPAGGEFMVATGQITGEGDLGRTLDKQRRIMKTSFRVAQAVLTNTPYLEHASLTKGLRNLLFDFDPTRFKRVSLPFAARPRLAPQERRRLLNDVLAEVNVAPITSRFAVMVPSRIDYTWKGQDLLLAAMEKVESPDTFTFVFSGWGADYQDFCKRTAGWRNIRVMECAVSKPILLDLAAGADLLVDQFKLGHIGTAAREAAAVGAPVMSWIASSPLGWFSRPDLPVINVREPVAIARAFNAIAAGKLDLEACSAASTAWIERYASPQEMAATLHRIIETHQRRNQP